MRSPCPKVGKRLKRLKRLKVSVSTVSTVSTPVLWDVHRFRPGNSTATWRNELDAMEGYHWIHLIVGDVDVQFSEN